MKSEMNEFEAAAHNLDTDSGWRQEVRRNRCASGFLDVEAEAEDGGGEMVNTQAGTVGWERSCSISACDKQCFEQMSRVVQMVPSSWRLCTPVLLFHTYAWVRLLIAYTAPG